MMNRWFVLIAVAMPVVCHGQNLDSMTQKELESRASELFQQGRYREALPFEERVVALGEKSANFDLAGALSDLGAVYRELGETEKAVSVLTRSLEINEARLGPEHADVARTLNILGLVYRDREDFAKAEPLLGRSLAIRQKIFPPGHPDIIRSMGNLGDTYRELGRYREAEQMLKQVVDLVESRYGVRNKSLISPLNNLATLYISEGKSELAAGTFERALALVAEFEGPDSLDAGVLHANIGEECLSLKRYKEAKEHLDLALGCLRQLGDDHPRVASVINNIGLLKTRTGDYAGATASFAEVVAIRERRQPGSSLLADALDNYAMSNWAAGNPQAAVQAFTKSAAIREVQIPQTLAIGSPDQKREFLESIAPSFAAVLTLHMTELGRSAEATRLAIREVLFRKGLLLDTLSNETGIFKNWTSDDKPMVDQLRQMRAEASTLWFAQRSSTDAFVKYGVNVEMERQLAGILRSRNPSLRIVTPVPTQQGVQSALPDGSVLLDYVRLNPVTPDGRMLNARYYCYAIARNGAMGALDVGPADEMDKLVMNFRRAIRERQDLKTLQAAGRDLEKRLFEPLDPLLSKLTRLVISPDARLSLLPFGALINADGRYAGERWTLSYLNSARDLARIPKEVAPRQGDMVFVNPAFGAVAAGGNGVNRSIAGVFADLPGAVREGAAVKSSFPSATVLTGSQASEEAIKDLHGPRILHLATHGFFLYNDEASADDKGRGVSPAPREATRNYKYDIDPMMRSGLALAGANTGGTPQENGILTALEACDLDLEGTDLVVLSACETGVGDTVSGDGVYGLRRAFALAGARTQVLSLWKVDDEATALLMAAFYDALKSGLPKDEALHHAQAKLLADGAHDDPYYWASFVLSGDGGALHTAPAGTVK